MHRKTKTGLTLITLLVLAACGEGSVGERIGLERKPPDEFRVLSRPPLNVPPEFNLRPPSDGSEDEGLETPASKAAEQTVFGTNLNAVDTAAMATAGTGSQGDQNFLNRAGASEAAPNIKKIIREENQETGYEDEKGFFEKLREPNKREPMVDAPKESERLKTNEAAGKPVDEGDTPTKLPKDRGIIDKIF